MFIPHSHLAEMLANSAGFLARQVIPAYLINTTRQEKQY